MSDEGLRVGGWTSSGSLLKKLALLVIVLLIVVVVAGPMMVDQPDAEVSTRATFYSSWEEDTGAREEESEVLGLVKYSSRKYERKEGGTGLLYVVAVNSLITPPGQALEDVVEEKVKERAEDNHIKLDDSSRTEGTLRIEAGFDADTIKWNGEVTGSGGAFQAGNNVKLLSAIWEADDYTIVCVGFGLTQSYLDQAKDLIENVEET